MHKYRVFWTTPLPFMQKMAIFKGHKGCSWTPPPPPPTYARAHALDSVVVFALLLGRKGYINLNSCYIHPIMANLKSEVILTCLESKQYIMHAIWKEGNRNESEKFVKFKYCQCNLLVQPHGYIQYTIDCIPGLHIVHPISLTPFIQLTCTMYVMHYNLHDCNITCYVISCLNPSI
jgi:uncharacterized membrane protein